LKALVACKTNKLKRLPAILFAGISAGLHQPPNEFSAKNVNHYFKTKEFIEK
jgi:hypothetical protein